MADRSAIENLDWLEPFDPHPRWRGGLLQTLSIQRVPSVFDPWDWSGCRMLEVPDDHTPPDTLSGIWPASDRSSPKPSVVVFHGMGGHAASGYMRSMADALLRAGHGVMLWNNRGARVTAPKPVAVGIIRVIPTTYAGLFVICTNASHRSSSRAWQRLGSRRART